MAGMNPARDSVVVRLVYDGPPHSGKTTSLGALATSLGSRLVSPAEAEGRTLYFDWLEYVGGSFEGAPIRCRILSVPGQADLAARRRALLAEADAVVFVLNGAPEELQAAAAHLQELRAFLDSREPPRPGIVVQANHRDRDDALPLPALAEALGLDGTAVVESVATENQGIREAFVLSVRLALDRMRELLRQGRLPADAGATDSPDKLLAALQALESELPGKPLPVAEEEAGAPAPPGKPDVPLLPDSSVPIGRIWPPVEGRIVLHSASSRKAVPALANDGSWRCQAGLWYFHSMPRHEFDRLEDGKQVLLSWAHIYGSGADRLSPYRCLVLAEAGEGIWRLWQIIRRGESLLQRLRTGLSGTSAAEAGELLGACAAKLLEARESFNSSPPLPCQLDVIGIFQDRPVYCGLLPQPGWKPSQEILDLSGEALVHREIQPLLEATGGEPDWREEVLAILDRSLPQGSQQSQ